MDNRIDQLEYTVMELGTEVFRLKSEISDMSTTQKQMVRTLKRLKEIMDEHGMICPEDFEQVNAAMRAEEEPSTDEVFEMRDELTKPEFH